jgi:hypothetical protein
MSKTVTFTDQDGCSITVFKTNENQIRIESKYSDDSILTELEKTEVIDLISILIKLVTEE